MRHASFFILIVLVAVWPDIAAAQSASTFQQLPSILGSTPATMEEYINTLYRLAIGVAAILVVLRLIYAGVQYMFSEVITNKGKAVEDIKNALLGLVIILGAVTILNTINPEITRIDILRNARTISTTPTRPSQLPAQQTHERTNISAYDKAVAEAEKCRGQVEKVANGNFKVICPGQAPPTQNPNNQQMTGWPQSATSYTEYLEKQQQCRQAGGSPDGEETSLNQYTVRCFR